MDFEEMNTEIQTSLEIQKQEILNKLEALKGSIQSSSTNENWNSLEDWLVKMQSDLQTKNENAMKNLQENNNKNLMKFANEVQDKNHEITATMRASVDNAVAQIQNSAESVSAKICKTVDAEFQKLNRRNAKELSRQFCLFAITAVFLVAVGGFGFWWVGSYANGKTAAEKALADTRAQIEKSAVESYKASNDFVIDGATYVANNFNQLRVLETLYQEMPGKDKEKFGLKEWLKYAHEEYKKNQKK